MQSTKHSVWNIANIRQTLITFIPSFWKLELPENRKFPRAVKRKQKEEGHSHIKILRYGVPSNTALGLVCETNRSGMLFEIRL